MKKAIIFLFLMAGVGAMANNLQINNVALTDNDPVAKTVIIRFDISWDHSWRDEINWDAAWVFAKFFDGELPYHHCKLSLEGALCGTGTAHELVVPNDSLQLEGVYYGVGAFIYRNALSDGTFDADSVMLKWNYGLNGIETLPADIEVHVYGTEMVYIPEGPFAFGDGDGTSMSEYSWHLKDSPDYVYVGDYLSPKMMIIFEEGYKRIHGVQGIDWDGDGNIDNPNFPTGYKAFYVMKYEATQGQYVDFLNSLTSNQISSSSLYPNVQFNDHTIFYQNQEYVCQHPDRSCSGFTSNFGDEDYRLLSFADFMGLRPLTEFEFEKSARGPLNSVYLENAWGNTASVLLSSISGQENGTETPIPQNANVGNGAFRVGIFANESTNRVSSGSSYFGVMDLSGNLFEGLIKDFRFQDNNGDGELSSNGSADSFFLKEANSIFPFYQYSNQWGRFTLISPRAMPGWINIQGCARFVRNAPILP